MIVVLDTNALVGDPHLRSTAWKILAHAARKWDVRLCTTEVVLLEASAGYQRRMEDSLVGLGRWKEKYGGLLSSQAEALSLSLRIEEDVSAYEGILREALTAIPVEILPIPIVPHQTLVRRAAGRIPPCDAKGDGYRDTLNWFAVLDLVCEDDAVNFVTADTDFTDATGLLHPALQEEVSQISSAGTVSILDSLPSVALMLASKFAKTEDQDVRGVQARLRQETLVEYVRDRLLQDQSTLPIRAQSLALPLSATAPLLVEVGEIRDSQLTVKAALEGNESAVEVSFTSDTTVLFVMPVGAELGTELQEVVGQSGQRLIQTVKALNFTALVTVDRFDQPSHGEVISVKAPADDPGHLQWRRAATNYLREQLKLPASTLEAIRNMGKVDLPASTLEAIRNMGKVDLPASTLEAIRNMGKVDLPASTLEAIRNMGKVDLPASTLEAIRNMGSVIPAAEPSPDLVAEGDVWNDDGDDVKTSDGEQGDTPHDGL